MLLIVLALINGINLLILVMQMQGQVAPLNLLHFKKKNFLNVAGFFLYILYVLCVKYEGG